MLKRRVISLLLAACLVLAVAVSGCSNEGSSQESSKSGQVTEISSSQVETAVVKETAKPKRNVELSLWTWKVAFVPGFEAAAAEFEKQTGIKVKVEAFTPDDTYKAKVSASANAANLADIVHYWAAIHEIENAFFELSNSGIIDQDWKSRFYKQAFNPVTVKQSQYDEWQSKPDVVQVKKDMKVGDVYGMPLEVGGFFTFYGNKKLIEQAGLKAEAPKTWEDFVSIMKTVKEKTGKAGLVMGAMAPDLWYNWCGTALEVMLNGEQGYQALMRREEKMNTPKHLPVVKALETVVQQGLLMPGCTAKSIDNADQAFASGEAAFVLGGSFTLANLIAMGKDPGEVIAFPVPPLQGSKYTEWKLTPFTLTDLMLSKNVKDKEAALDFMKFITSKEGALLFANNAFSVPAIDLGGDAEKLIPELKQITQAYVNQGSSPLDNIEEYPNKFWDNAEWRRHDARIQRMISGDFTAEKVAQDFDARMEELLGSGTTNSSN